jgi:alkanesulfonate monooxygenase SsuD/methylene tetrahydromethanopterin reductase-like flavin-dependent oxidoreductase (luciferase family)
LGYDSITFTEHHFHIEGFELPSSDHAALAARLGLA